MSLVGRYELNEGSGTIGIDSSGLGNTVTWNGSSLGDNGTHYTTFNGVTYGNFDGSDNFLSSPYVSAYDFTGDFSVSFTIYPQNLSGTNGIIGMKTSDSSPGWQIYHDSGDGNQLRLRIGDNTGTQDGISSPGSVLPHVVTQCTVARASGTITWYFNGTIDTSTVTTKNSTGSTANFNIGVGTTWSGSYFNGLLSNISINSAAVTPATVPPVNVNEPPLGYRIGNSDRPIGGSTGAPNGFAVLNLSNGNVFTAQNGVWTTESPSFDFAELVASWYGTNTANMNGNVIGPNGPGFRIGNSDRIVGGPTGAPNGFYVLNLSTGNAFQAQGGVWVGGVTFPADLLAAWMAT